MNSTAEIFDNDTTTLIVTLILLFTLYWSIRGFIQLFQRHNSILVIFYLVFLFPIAYCHMLILGIFGSSKRQRFLREAEEEAKHQEAVLAGCLGYGSGVVDEAETAAGEDNSGLQEHVRATQRTGC